MTKRTLLAGLAGLFIAACGGGGDDPDAGDDSPPADARIDGPPGGCSFTEANDTGNDNVATPEATGQTLAAAAFTVCGTGRAMAPVMNLIDNDAFSFEVGAATQALIRLEADLGGTQALLGVDMFDSADNYIGQGLFIGGHAVMTTPTLDPGTYRFEVFAVGADAPGAPIPYTASLTTDNWDTRCPALSGNPTYTEANDGGQNNGNDMVNVTYGANPPIVLTNAPGDNPELSAITAAAGMSYKIQGSSAVRTGADSYLDKDTFQFHTGPDTNQVDIRLQWPDADADLDVFLFTLPLGTPPQVVALGSSLLESLEAPEFFSTAVLPDTDYWIWVGAYETPVLTAAKQYGATICATAVAP